MQYGNLQSVLFHADDLVAVNGNQQIINRIELLLNDHACWRICTIDFNTTPEYKVFALVRKEDNYGFEGRVTISKERNLYRFDIVNDDDHSGNADSFFIDEDRFKRLVKNIS